MELTEIGRFGKPHGLKGEIKASVEPAYEDTLLEAKAIFVRIGSQSIPYFIEYARGGGALIIKLEEVNDKETAAVFFNKAVSLPADQVPALEEEYPLPPWEGFTIEDETIGTIGTIEELVEMPQQILALVIYQEREVLIPLHEDLILALDPERRHILMDLPEGLLDLG